MDLVSIATFLKSPTCRGVLIIFFSQKLYFVELCYMVYSIHHLEALVLKLRAFKARGGHSSVML